MLTGLALTILPRQCSHILCADFTAMPMPAQYVLADRFIPQFKRGPMKTALKQYLSTTKEKQGLAMGDLLPKTLFTGL